LNKPQDLLRKPWAPTQFASNSLPLPRRPLY
jgi:hypothetical protein